MVANKISAMSIYNLESTSTELICDVVKLSLCNPTGKQDLFLDPQFLGINIGGAGVEKLWKDNLLDDYVYELTTIIVD